MHPVDLEQAVVASTRTHGPGVETGLALRDPGRLRSDGTEGDVDRVLGGRRSHGSGRAGVAGGEAERSDEGEPEQGCSQSLGHGVVFLLVAGPESARARQRGDCGEGRHNGRAGWEGGSCWPDGSCESTTRRVARRSEAPLPFVGYSTGPNAGPYGVFETP